MHYMEDLKNLLCAELQEYAENGKRSGKMSKADIEVIDTVLNSVKNIYKIDKYEMEIEGGYSEDTDFMGEGRMSGTSYDGGSSYARGRGRNAKRDSMGRYSRDGYSMEGGSSYERGGNRGGSGRGNSHGGSRGGQGGGYSRAGGYSRDDAKHDMIEELEELMGEAESEKERDALRRCIRAIEEA